MGIFYLNLRLTSRILAATAYLGYQSPLHSHIPPLIGAEDQLILPVGVPCYISNRAVEQLILPVGVPCYITNRGRGATYPACGCTL
jgi:hypothetical protein